METKPRVDEHLGETFRRAGKLALLLDDGVKYSHNDLGQVYERIYPDEVYILPIWQILVLKAAHYLPNFIRNKIQARFS